MDRYQRQLIIPNWGIETQQRLRDSKAFVAGAGGLGCPAAMNLALAGVGRIRICDSDTVELSNLNRQFLHSAGCLGMNKVDSACSSLSSINPDVCIEPCRETITEDNADDLVAEADIIIDCLDNFAARRALNNTAVKKGIPMVHGAVWGMEGRLTFLYPPHGPCLDCIFPKSPDRREIPVIGAIACAIGSLQALEAIKYLAGLGELLIGRLLVLDGTSMEFQSLEVVRDPSCKVCGNGA
jgi:molybdopterin/thiamine biosynthesis adenylyltransferase